VQPRLSTGKCIIIEDSQKQFLGSFNQSSAVSGRDPFKQDPQINYELDSEEELAEAQGEDLNSNQVQGEGDDEDEDMGSAGEDQEGFLVSDGHLSDEEYNFSQEC
jgi:chromatin assembly factor 1 subunit A